MQDKIAHLGPAMMVLRLRALVLALGEMSAPPWWRTEYLSGSALSQHMDWRLFGLSCEHVHQRLDKLGEERGLLIQRAGSVVSITWRVKSMKELIDVLAR